MNNPSSSSTPPDAPQDGLRVLCFDGGGVRGKASLILLKQLMGHVGQGAKPCEFFDLIAGTSTGGLIALMLARLQYSVADAIKKYDELGPQIFCNVAPESHWARFGTPLVDEAPAERAFQELGREGEADGYVDNGYYDGCKCLVTTVLQDSPNNLVPIRSYPCNDMADPITFAGEKWKIWEAARAATAVPVYFRHLEKGRCQFIDAAAGYNNPSAEVFGEIKTNIPEFKDRPIACFVSIGTGVGPPHPAPGKAKQVLRRILPNYSGIKELVQYLGAVATNTAIAHTTMQRLMPSGPYFRFDPGGAVGLINLADPAALLDMSKLVWKHMQQDTRIEEMMKDCASKLQAASSVPLRALLQSNPNVEITPTRRSLPASAVQRGWVGIPELLELALAKSDDVPFPMIFSLPNYLNRILASLVTRYHGRDTSETIRGCILFLVNKFVCDLWLTNAQISYLCDSFIKKPNNTTTNDDPNDHLLLRTLTDNLKKNKVLAVQDYSLLHFIGSTELKDLAEELAEALAILEDNLRRTDPVGECVRWKIQSSVPDLLSFPERVKHWVLYSILHAELVNMRGFFHLFYKVAKRSRDIYNLSALRAIMSALEMLGSLRKAMKLEPQGLQDMLAINFTVLGRNAERKNKPHLLSFEDLKDWPIIDFAKLADTRQHIHWDRCQTLLSELKGFTSRPSPCFTSPQKYVFSRDRIVAFVKQSLVEVTVIDRTEQKVQDTIIRYKQECARRPAPLWRRPSSSGRA